MPRIVLASQSPRRRDLLRAAGVEFEVVTVEAEESFDPTMPPDDLCMLNAEAKAEAAASQHPSQCVIGSDTLVFLDDKPLGKPRDLNEARATLRRLSGRTHFVCTGVCLIYPEGKSAFAERTHVTFRELDEAIIEEYLSKVHVLDKAGSYAWQEYGDLIISQVDGDEDNVIGLPIARLMKELKSVGYC